VLFKYGFISDRYAYGVLVALACLIGALLTCAHSSVEAAVQNSRFRGMLVWLPAVFYVCTLPLTWARDASWKSERSLQLAMVTDRPDDPESKLAASALLIADSDWDGAYSLCRAYAALRPMSDKANFCIGRWLLMHGKPDEATGYLRPYALARPGFVPGRRAFLVALYRSGGLREAKETVEMWSRMFPGAPDLEEARVALEKRTWEEPRP
jgi:hypothetical protein